MSRKIAILFLVMMIAFLTCDFPTYEEITKPATVRVWLTYSLGEGSAFSEIVQENDSLKVECTNFRLYNDSLYARFFQDVDMFRQNRDSVKAINVLSQNSDTLKIAEGLVPPYDYTRLEFQMTPVDTSFVVGGKRYPLNYQGIGAETIVRIEDNFPHDSEKITDIYLTYYANKGVRRLSDEFYFSTVGDDSSAISDLKIKQK